MINPEILALIIATLIAAIPNIIFKLLDRIKPKEDLTKKILENTDLSIDIVKEALEIKVEENKKICEENIKLTILLKEVIILLEEILVTEKLLSKTIIGINKIMENIKKEV